MAVNAEPIKNCDIGPCELYIGREYVGMTQGNASLEFPETSFMQKYGLPAMPLGTIVTERAGKITYPCIYMSKENLELITGGTVQTTEKGDLVLNFGTGILKPIITDVCLHHHNKITDEHQIIAIWKMQCNTALSLQYSDVNPTQVMVLNMEFDILADFSDAHINTCPLGQIYWSDTFDINNLPWDDQPGPGPEPPGPDSHVIENEEVILSNHAGTLAHGKVSAYTVKNNAADVTLEEGTDYQIDTNTGTVTMLDGSDYYNATDIKVSYTWWDNRTQETAEEVTSVDAGGGNYRYELAHSPIENANTLVVTDSTGATTYELDADYTCQYDNGYLWSVSASPMAASNVTVKASYYYYSNNEE